MVEAIPDVNTVEGRPDEMDEQPTDLQSADANVNDDRNVKWNQPNGRQRNIQLTGQESHRRGRSGNTNRRFT